MNDDRVTRVNFKLFGLKNEMPDAIYDLDALTHFQIREGNLVFKVDERLQNMQSIELLSLFAPNIEVDDLAILCGLPNLINLTLNSVKSNGVIPPCFFELTLDRAYLIRMDFAGQEIPAEFGEMESLVGLILTNCGFTGAVPEALCAMENLKFLYLDENKFTAPIPSCLPGPVSQQFIIDNCGFSGPINFANLAGDLGILRANGNSFTGDLKDLVYMPNLYSFQFAGSEFTGAFDANAFDKEWILNVNISDNNVDELVNWSAFGERLNFLNVADNKLDFSDLETVELMEKVNFIYAPQQLLTADAEHELDAGASISFNCPAGGLNTTYQWFKNGIPISAATNTALTITDLQLSDVGEYYCEAMNTDFPELTLFSGLQTVDVLSNWKNIETNSLNLFPNPANEELFIAIDFDIEELHLINTLGEIVRPNYEKADSNVRVDLTALSNGMYFLILNEEGKSYVEKIQILKD